MKNLIFEIWRIIYFINSFFIYMQEKIFAKFEKF